MLLMIPIPPMISSAHRTLAFHPGCPKPVFNGKPVGELFTLAERCVSIIVDMTDFVNQNIVQIEITNRILSPDQSPERPVFNPSSAEHFHFDALRGSGGSNVEFFQ